MVNKMSWTFLRQIEIVAKKEHKCLLCGESIIPKEIYRQRIGASDGKIITMKMHRECEIATQKWDNEDWETFDVFSFDRPCQRG